MWLIFGSVILGAAVLIEMVTFFRNLYTEQEIENHGSSGNFDKAITINGLCKLEKVCNRFVKKLNKNCKCLRAEGRGEEITYEHKSMVCPKEFFTAFSQDL